MTYSLIDRLQDCGTDLAEEAIAQLAAKDALIRELYRALKGIVFWNGADDYTESLAALTRAKEAGYE